VTLNQAQQFLDQATQAGLEVKMAQGSDTSGTVIGYGAEVDYRYSTEAQQLTLMLAKHPPFMQGMIWHQIEQRLPAGVQAV
jgi:hypothetical protein